MSWFKYMWPWPCTVGMKSLCHTVTHSYTHFISTSTYNICIFKKLAKLKFVFFSNTGRKERTRIIHGKNITAATFQVTGECSVSVQCYWMCGCIYIHVVMRILRVLGRVSGGFPNQVLTKSPKPIKYPSASTWRYGSAGSFCCHNKSHANRI